MKQLGQEFKVGMFTLLGILATGGIFLVLSPRSFDRGLVHSYYTVLEDASGILPRTHVKTNGVTVGKVKEVRLEINQTRVVLEVDASVKIPNGSTVEVRTVGLLGDKFIEIMRNKAATPEDGLVKDGDFIPRATDGTDMTALISIAGSIAKDVKRVTSAFAGVLGDKAGEDKIRGIVENIESITENAKGILADNRSDVRQLIANIKEASITIAKVMDEGNREKIDRIIASFDTTMQDVKAASHSIRLASDKIERGEGTIGRLINDDKTLTELEGAIKEIRDVISPASKLEVAVDYHGELRRDESAQNYFNLQFKTRPDRYYIIGFTDRETDKIQTTTATENQASGEVKTTEVRRTERALRYNLQYAKRWYFAALRFGLFESTGGVASDFYLWKDRLKFSFEAFEFKSKDNPYRNVAHLKTYASVLFFNHVYAMIGVDDLTRLDADTGKVNKTPNVFFGAGFNFNDDDIKALFGAASLAR